MGTGLASDLAAWATTFAPSSEDLALADRSLADTVAVLIAARSHPLTRFLPQFSEGGQWACLAHALDFDDLHMESTTHVSTVCVPAALASGGGPRAYLAAAGVMSRLGAHLGWKHYTSGWHATCTAGAVGAAVAFGVARGLDRDRLAAAMALALPAAGGVQRAFGTDTKPLQVAMAVDAGARAVALATLGASTTAESVEQWAGLLGADLSIPVPALDGGPAVPGGLAIKLFPCCYALQRPIQAMRAIGALEPAAVERITVRASEATVAPLIGFVPTTGPEGKFSLEYALATTLLDGWPGIASFTDEAVQRPEAQSLLRKVRKELVPGGGGLLDDVVTLDVVVGGRSQKITIADAEGTPDLPASEETLARKIDDCLEWGGVPEELNLAWDSAAAAIRRALA